MATLFSASDRNLALESIARRLTGEPVVELTLLTGQGNNRIYRVDTPTACFALKVYPSDGNRCVRLDREYNALRFLNANGAAGRVPRALAVDYAGQCALYEWVDGTALVEHGPRDIDAAVAFIASAHAARLASAARALPPATEACLSTTALFAQITERLGCLRVSSGPDAALDSFLNSELEPTFTAKLTACRDWAQRSGVALDCELKPANRTLSPSDFSFHNSLRRADGSIVFLDFEYFGWDDPVKLVSDFLWHPGMHISRDDAHRFVAGMHEIFVPTDPDFVRRLHAHFPFYGIKWCLIMLNEFRADGWSRRLFSGERRSRDEVKAAQLRKACALLAQIKDGTRASILC